MEKIKEFTLLTKAMSSFTKLIILIIVAVVLGIQLMSMVGKDKTAVEEASVVPVSSVVDIIAGLPVNVELASSVEKEEVYKMPEFILSMPNTELFTGLKMQIIAASIGLTEKAAVKNFGNQAVWVEGNKMLLIDPQIGLINYSTAVNLGGVSLPNQKPTEQTARDALNSFIEETQIPTDFLDLDTLTFEPMYIDDFGGISPSLVADGPLMRINIPYQVVGVRVILPIDSYMVVDGEGKIYLLSLVIPNIKQTDKMITLVSWGTAKNKLESGEGGLISGSTNDSIVIDRSYPAYYLSQRDFYNFDSRRYFTSVYVFEDGDNQAVVLAERQ